MKYQKMTSGLLVLGASLFLTVNAPAFPLYLISASGKINYTPSYDYLGTSNVVKRTFVSVNMKTLMTIVSNQVFRVAAVSVPRDARIAYDPYDGSTFLTNKTGFYKSLTDIVTVRIRELSTSFKQGTNTVTESDATVARLDVYGYGPDGRFFEFRLEGYGSLRYNVERNQRASMRISVQGAGGYGEYQDSDEGVSSGNFTFSGTGAPQWSGPYSAYWWEH